jgi:hypothetical protein
MVGREQELDKRKDQEIGEDARRQIRERTAYLTEVVKCFVLNGRN